MEKAPRHALGLLPEDFAALGYQRDPAHLFGRLQRVSTWQGGAPVLGRAARDLLGERVDLHLPRIASSAPSSDGATRHVLALADGERVEAVHMPRATRSPRTTICLSTQVGCAMGCTFCATAQMGLRRSLAPAEIVGQLLAVMLAHDTCDAGRVNLVFMGMGEPLHHVDALLRALDLLCHPAGLGIAPSRITVSTVGIVPNIDRLAASPHRPTLALSVNEVTDAARVRLMPIAKRWSLAELKAALTRWPRRPHEKITLEYVVLGGVNHDDGRAHALADFAAGLRHVVNLIPFNSWSARGITPYREPTEEELQRFARILHARGCLVTVRRSRGRDARAACGTLTLRASSLQHA